ncbi:MAG: hypothetical protein EOR86_15490 [Mesorhizobium sp.]|nr:MAG: hypothetical protein EOR86_15490 [Mesorhizobium sp.]
MRMSWMFAGVKRNAPGVILIIAMFASIFALDPHKWANDASPIRLVEPMNATVKSTHWDKGSPSIYMLVLDDGSSVFIDDNQPHLIGSRVTLERVTRDNGFVFYRFPE